MAAEGLSVIIFFRASLRSLWSPFLVSIGLVFALIGVGLLADPRIGSQIDIFTIVLGLGATGGGLAFAWGGSRLGVVRTPAGLKVRELGESKTYTPDMLAGFSVGEHDHDTLPVKVVFPVLRMAKDDDVPVMSLANYAIFPGARKRATKAVKTMAEWTGRPVLE